MRFAGPLYDGEVRDDALPDRLPDRISGGLGSGGSCAICSRRINADELEFALEYAAGERSGAYTVHLACYSAWKSRSRELEANRATVAGTELSRAVADPKFAVDERQGSREQGEA